MRTLNKLKTLLAVLVVALLTLPVFAKDVLILDDGRRVEGEIVREIDGNIWMIVHMGTIRTQEFFSATSIAEVIRGVVVEKPKDEPSRRSPTGARAGVPRGTVITLEGMVGVEMAAHKLEELIPILEQEIGEGGILVLKINSGGGFLAEILPLSDVIEHKLKPKFEVVGWIDSAISAAAMTGITLERLYFLPNGNIGAATGWYGALTAVSGRELEEALYMMERITARGKRDPRIMRSMQVDDPLSATIDPRTGEVTWYQDEDSGEILVNPKGEILTFNSVMAEQLRFSEGIARNLDELTRLMGYEEVDWVGDWRRDLIFPVGRAERENRRWREFIDQNNQGLAVAANKYLIYLNGATGVPRNLRGRVVGKARQYLAQIKRYHDMSPKLVTVAMGLNWNLFDQWYEEQIETLRRLME